MTIANDTYVRVNIYDVTNKERIEKGYKHLREK